MISQKGKSLKRVIQRMFHLRRKMEGQNGYWLYWGDSIVFPCNTVREGNELKKKLINIMLGEK